MRSGSLSARYLTVYANRAREAYKGVPIIVGGLEASLRRMGHYDYWSDSYKKSILIDSKADLLVYGMGEQAIVAVAKALQEGKTISEMTEIPQTAYVAPSIDGCAKKPVELYSYEDCLKNKILDAKNFRIIEEQSNLCKPEKIAQRFGELYVIVNEPNPTMTTEELDAVYALPYSRLPHSRYAK